MTATVEVHGTDVALAERLFERWIGFDIRGAAPRRLEEFLVSRAAHLGYSSVTDYLRALPTKRPTTAEAQRLANVLTNGLTAFWRDRAQIEALGSLLAQLHGRYERPLNVWCAGAATGEEAYTVAIAAAEHDVPVSVLGTDVNTAFLDVARRAEFDDWALRRMLESRRERWFERRGERWAIDHSLASLVEFRYHNLLDLPPTATGGSPWDVILCRNVMIYLTDAAMSRILMHFATSIATDGYLFLGSSEQITDPMAPFRATQKGPAFVYRPIEIDPGQSLPLPESGEEEPAPDLSSATLDEETVEFTEQDAVRQLLNAGVNKEDAEDAVACFEAAAGYEPFAGEIYALLAETLAAEGAEERAIDALGKVLFLDPDNWWACARRAMLHERREDRVEAHRHWRIALESLEARPSGPFDPTLAIGPLADVNRSQEKIRAAAVEGLDRLSR